MGSLSQPRLNIFTVGNMRVMICLGQGGLRSLSVSSVVFSLLLNRLPKLHAQCYSNGADNLGNMVRHKDIHTYIADTGNPSW